MRWDVQLIGIAIFGLVALLMALFAPFDSPARGSRWLFELLGPDGYRMFSRTLFWIVAIGSGWAFWDRLRFLRQLRRIALNKALLEPLAIRDHALRSDE